MKTAKNTVNKPSKSSTKKDPVQAAIDYGIDIQMLKDNINRTPAERIKRHQAALNTVKKLRKAKHI